VTRKGLVEPVLALLSKRTAAAVLESELVDLLGLDDLPLLQALLPRAPHARVWATGGGDNDHVTMVGNCRPGRIRLTPLQPVGRFESEVGKPFRLGCCFLRWVRVLPLSLSGWCMGQGTRPLVPCGGVCVGPSCAISRR